jgi:MFS transporter, FSR family, fosmidomycin resistance protein
VLTLGLAGLAAVGVAATGTAPAFVVAVAFMGIGAGIYHPPGLTTVATITHQRGRALAFHGIAGNLGIAATPLFAFLLPLGWQAPFLLFGIAATATAVMAGTLPAISGARGANVDRGPGTGPVWLPFIAIISLLFLGGFALKAVKYFLQHDVQAELDALALPIPAVYSSGTLVAAAYLMGAFGQRRGGRMLDTWGADRVFGLALACTGVACLAMAVVPGVWVVLPAGVFAYFYFMGQSPSNELIARFIGPRWRGMGFGIHFTVQFGLGSAGAAFAGWAAERGALWMAFAVSGAACLLAAGGSLGLRPLVPGARAALEGEAR